MDNLQGIRQVGPNQWKGFRVLRIDSLPARIPSALAGDIVNIAIREQTSVELCLFSSEDRIVPLLYLRTQCAYSYEAIDRLTRVTELVRRHMAQEDVQAALLDANAPEIAEVNRRVSAMFEGSMSGMGMFPPEAPANAHSAYWPGSYEGHQPRIPLERLVSLLAGSGEAVLSIQLSRTQLYPKELMAIQKIRVVSGRENDPIRRQAAQAYAALEQHGGETQLFVNLFCCGDSYFMSDAVSLAAQLNLETYAILPAPADAVSYALSGNERISLIAAERGHAPLYLGRLPMELKRLTHIATVQSMLAAITMPTYSNEFKGITSTRTTRSSAPLPETLTNEDGLYLGNHFESGRPIYINLKSLTRHGFFVGKPGSGKTVFALGLLHRIYTEKRIPFLAIEPAKREYRSLLDVIPNLKVYTPGRQSAAPMQLNPFLPPRGIPLELYRPLLKTIFSMAIAMPHPLDVIFPQVISRCYAKHGWRPDSTRDSEGVRVFGMLEFIREFRAYTQENYASDKEALHNIENGGVVRLNALMDNPLFDTNNSVDIEELLDSPTVIELDAISNADEKALVMGILLAQVQLVLHKRGDSHSALRGMILIDEAHLLLSQGSSNPLGGTQTNQEVISMLQEMTVILRSSGTALIYGDQSPARLTQIILNNVNMKMVFRLDSRQDRAILADTSRMDDVTDSMVTLPTGDAYLTCDMVDHPVRLHVPNYEEQLHLNKQLSDERVRESMHIAPEPPFSQCASCGRCDFTLRSNGKFIASRLIDEPAVRSVLRDARSPEDQLCLADYIADQLDDDALRLAKEFSVPTGDSRFLHCVRAQFIRALLISPQFLLDEQRLTAPRRQAPRREEAEPEQKKELKFHIRHTRDDETDEFLNYLKKDVLHSDEDDPKR